MAGEHDDDLDDLADDDADDDDDVGMSSRQVTYFRYCWFVCSKLTCFQSKDGTQMLYRSASKPSNVFIFRSISIQFQYDFNQGGVSGVNISALSSAIYGKTINFPFPF